MRFLLVLILLSCNCVFAADLTKYATAISTQDFNTYMGIEESIDKAYDNLSDTKTVYAGQLARQYMGTQLIQLWCIGRLYRLDDIDEQWTNLKQGKSITPRHEATCKSLRYMDVATQVDLTKEFLETFPKIRKVQMQQNKVQDLYFALLLKYLHNAPDKVTFNILCTWGRNQVVAFSTKQNIVNIQYWDTKINEIRKERGWTRN